MIVTRSGSTTSAGQLGDRRRHVLFLSFPMYGHVFPTLSVAEELGHRGRRVTYATAESFAPYVKRAGVELLCYDERLASIPSRVSDHADTNEVTMTSLLFVEQSMRSLAPDGFGCAVDRPDLVVCDPLNFVAAAALCDLWDVPLVTAHPNVAFNETFYWPGEHRRQLLADPVRGPRAVELEASIARLAARNGVDEVRMNRADDAALVFAPRALQPHAESFGDNYAFVGPCTDGSAYAGEWRPADERPVLFISLGTLYNRRPEHLCRFARAFGELNWRVVMSTGGGDSAFGTVPVPPNFELHSWVPQLSVLEHAAVFLTNGGLGGITSALQQGTPLVLVPEAAEQEMHAGQVAGLGLGRVVRLAESTPERLRDIVVELAADDATLSRVRDMRALIAEAGGTRRAADTIEARLP